MQKIEDVYTKFSTEIIREKNIRMRIPSSLTATIPRFCSIASFKLHRRSSVVNGKQMPILLLSPTDYARM